jgi:hypothetical protein
MESVVERNGSLTKFSWNCWKNGWNGCAGILRCRTKIQVAGEVLYLDNIPADSCPGHGLHTGWDVSPEGEPRPDGLRLLAHGGGVLRYGQRHSVTGRASTTDSYRY